MAVIDVHPHTIKYFDESEGYVDERGDYHEGESTCIGEIKCKAVPTSGQPNIVTFDDGSAKKVSWVCYFDPQDHFFEFGNKIVLSLTHGMEKEYRVAGFVPYQLRHKLWLA